MLARAECSVINVSVLFFQLEWFIFFPFICCIFVNAIKYFKKIEYNSAPFFGWIFINRIHFSKFRFEKMWSNFCISMVKSANSRYYFVSCKQPYCKLKSKIWNRLCVQIKECYSTVLCVMTSFWQKPSKITEKKYRTRQWMPTTRVSVRYVSIYVLFANRRFWFSSHPIR